MRVLGRIVRIRRCPDLVLQRTAKCSTEAWGQAGTYIGCTNHGTCQIGDTFTERREPEAFTAIPALPPDWFPPGVRLEKDPLKSKANCVRGLRRLAGGRPRTQVFFPETQTDHHLECGRVTAVSTSSPGA